MKDKKIRPKDQDPEQPEATQATDEELDALRQGLEELRQEKDDVQEKLQRLCADYANFQKRVPRQIADTVTYEREKLMRSLLPILDNFDHTLKAHSAESTEALVKGVEIIYGQMLDILKSHGVEQIQALGETFDPQRHEAMLRRAEPDQDDGIILEEFQKGYVLNGRVLRPSRVVVNKVQTAETQQVEEAPGGGTDAPGPDSVRENDVE
jgi:molecular chaperone GrpE